MTVQVLLETLSARGVILEAEGGRIHWRGKLTDEDKARLKEHKAEVISLLASTSKPARSAEPYISPEGDLVIPFNSEPRYHYWRGG